MRKSDVVGRKTGGFTNSPFSGVCIFVSPSRSFSSLVCFSSPRPPGLSLPFRYLCILPPRSPFLSFSSSLLRCAYTPSLRCNTSRGLPVPERSAWLSFFDAKLLRRFSSFSLPSSSLFFRALGTTGMIILRERIRRGDCTRESSLLLHRVNALSLQYFLTRKTNKRAATIGGFLFIRFFFFWGFFYKLGETSNNGNLFEDNPSSLIIDSRRFIPIVIAFGYFFLFIFFFPLGSVRSPTRHKSEAPKFRPSTFSAPSDDYDISFTPFPSVVPCRGSDLSLF